MGVVSRVYRGENDFDFPRSWKPLGIISIILVVGSIVSLFGQGLNLSIDFEGGSVWEVRSQTLTQAQAEEVLSEFGDGTNVAERFQEATTADGERVLRVSGRVDDIQTSTEISKALADAANIDVGDVAVTTVGPSWGKDITRTARNSLVIFMVLVAAYIAWRLEPRMAVAGMIAVVHDILLTVGFYSVFQIEVSPATVIAFLTILGFSLYDTIVVYDRMQENAARLTRTGEYTYTGITRRSLNQVLMRSVNTTIVTLLPVLSLLVIGEYVLGEPTLGDFSLALLVGLASGAYSSLCVAAPLTAWLKEREVRYIDIRERMKAKGLDPDDSSWHGVRGIGGVTTPRPATTTATSSATVPTTRSGASQARRPGQAPALGVNVGGHPPRPRKNRPKR